MNPLPDSRSGCIKSRKDYPMSLLSKLAKNSTPVQAKAEVVHDAAPDGHDIADTTALSLMPESTGVTAADVLNQALSTEAGRADNKFAIVNLTGGPSGGMFAPAEFLPQEVQDSLPSGKKPIPGVLMGYRLAVSAWPVGYTDAPADKNAQKSKPVYACSVSANDAAVLPLALKAARNYQFTKSQDKSKFDYATSSAGHIRVAVELLVYSGELGQPIVISTPSNFGAVEATLQNIQKLIDPKTGSLGQFPCTVRPVSEEKSSKGGFTWKQHSLDITNVAGQADGANSWNSYGAWKQEAVKDAATVQAVRDWISAQDRKADA